MTHACLSDLEIGNDLQCYADRIKENLMHFPPRKYFTPTSTFGHNLFEMSLYLMFVNYDNILGKGIEQEINFKNEF